MYTKNVHDQGSLGFFFVDRDGETSGLSGKFSFLEGEGGPFIT